MLIGVDAVAFLTVRAGVSRYLSELLDRIMALSPEDEFVLYSPKPIAVPLSRGGWHVRVPDRKHVRLPGHWLRDTIPRAIAEDGVDVFWGQNITVPLRLVRPCRRVLTVHDVAGVVCPRTMRLRPRLSWCLNFRSAVRAADAVVVDSMATGRLLCGLMLVPPEKVTVVYPGNPGSIAPLPVDVARGIVAERFSLTGDFMLAVGTIEPRKDYKNLVRALRATPGAPLLAIVGSVGWNCRDILRTIREAEADGLVKYLGRASDGELSALYSAARVAVYPSFYEGFGLPVLEAMACGCPVLCSWSSSLPEVGGKAASYFRPRDAEDLAHKLRGLLSDGGRLTEMRMMGPIQSARFSSVKAAERVLAVLRGDGRVS
jgi:glycosyltransferase involved in cell wall biosynthesis